ncbi:MAG TPA: class I lanthipeptide [Kouleothrix sp.]|uniref:class I lanthipeptide n=1 Tax=Kouleothrix sp. TaxID=2779161 RepID=UPI002CA2171B|nr:class I lanthipeptide [Kouleothrix sp.]HRC74328.1 class I lanthipeptide [Kouleothrix sp.]
MGADDQKKASKGKKGGKKLELNKETVQELNDEQLDDAAGGAQYNSNGCGTRYSYRGQLTCDPGTTNPVPPQTLG